ncbi:hypothetical protein QUC31_011470, partial [Theobroma cacao]
MERSDSRLLDMKSFSLSPNSTMERSDSLLTGASSRSCKYVLTTLMQEAKTFDFSLTGASSRSCKYVINTIMQMPNLASTTGNTHVLMSKFYETEQNFRPLIAMEKAVDFLWNEEALLLLAK